MGTSKKNIRGKGCTISLKAAVHPGHMLQALIMKKKTYIDFYIVKTIKMNLTRQMKIMTDSGK